MSFRALATGDGTVDPAVGRRIIRDAVTVAVAVGAYAMSFGALAVAAHFSIAQAAVLSAFAFTGASQFALVGVLGSGGTAASAVSVALLLAARNGLYAVRMTPAMRWRGWRRLLGAHLTIDETTAMAMARTEPAELRLAFWATGISLWLLWNLSTVAGALAGSLIGSPQRWGLDVAFPAAFLALLAPQLRTPSAAVSAIAAVVAALVLVPIAPVGVPILAAAVTVLPISVWFRASAR